MAEATQEMIALARHKLERLYSPMFICNRRRKRIKRWESKLAAHLKEQSA